MGTVMNTTVKYTAPASEADEASVSIADTARSARRRLWIVVLVPLLTVSAAVGASLLQQPVYDASAEVVLSPRGSQQDNLSNTISGLQVLAVEMEATGLNRSMVEEIVNAQEEPGAVSEADINDNLTIAQLEETRFLTLTYSDADKTLAQEVVNNAAEIFAREAPEASGVATYAAAKVSAYGGVPRAPEEPDLLRNAFGALLIGLMLGLGLAFLLEYLYLRGLHSPEKVEHLSGVPTFGAIPDFGATRRAKKKERGT